jgi:hypothetical protein
LVYLFLQKELEERRIRAFHAFLNGALGIRDGQAGQNEAAIRINADAVPV